jgi:hypothetical protein
VGARLCRGAGSGKSGLIFAKGVVGVSPKRAVSPPIPISIKESRMKGTKEGFFIFPEFTNSVQYRKKPITLPSHDEKNERRRIGQLRMTYMNRWRMSQ